MGIYNSSKFAGPAWSRDRGYHTPTPLPAHIMRIITQPKPAAKSKDEKPKIGPDEQNTEGGK